MRLIAGVFAAAALVLLALAIGRTLHPLWAAAPLALAAAIMLRTTCHRCGLGLGFRRARLHHGDGRLRYRCPRCGCFLT